MKRRSWDDAIFAILSTIFLIGVLIAIAVPIWRVIMMSITPIDVIKDTAFGLWVAPDKWSIEAYKQLFTHPSFIKAASNSGLIMGLGTAINLFLTIPLAYALSEPNLPGKKFLTIFILIPFLFSAGLIPTYLVVQKLSLVNTIFAVILPTAVSVYNTLVMRKFFEGLPRELKEAARLDGASELQVLIRVILPLSKPIILTIGMFYAVSHWNNFFAPVLYLNSPDLITLPVLLRNILMAASMNEYIDYDAFSMAPVEALKAAAVIITMIPMVIIYPWIQKHFTKGTLLGGVKE